jgi:hypothetical protein
MANKSLNDYLPPKENKVAVHANCRESLVIRAKQILAQKEVSWVEFLEGSLQKLIDENKDIKAK